MFQRLVSLMLAICLMFIVSPGVNAQTDLPPGSDTVPCVKPPEGMIAWWPLDETHGSVARNLVKGNYNLDGLHVGNPQPVDGMVEGALRFDGINDYVNVAHPLGSPDRWGKSNLSFDAWISTTQSSGLGTILDKRSNIESGNVQGVHVFVYKGMLGIQLADGIGFTNWYSSKTYIADGKWHLIAITVDRVGIGPVDPGGKVYIDGKLVFTFDPSIRSGSVYNEAPLRFGARSNNSAGFFAGILDEVEIFNRVLSQKEIQSLYTAGSAGKCKPAPVPALGGEVVFVSDRVGQKSAQLFLKDLRTGVLQQLTDYTFSARYPTWSYNGHYIAYTTRDVIVGEDVEVDVLVIIDRAGKQYLWFYGSEFEHGYHYIQYPEWSRDGKRIVVTVYNDWGRRALAVIEFNTPYDFESGYTTYELLPGINAPHELSGTDAVFSPDGKYIYFHADSDLASGELYRAPAIGPAYEQVYLDGRHWIFDSNGALLGEVVKIGSIDLAYAVSISPDGARLMYNSEMYRRDPVKYLDEELMEVSLLTGGITQLTYEPGNQYGDFAKGGSGEYIMQSNKHPGAKRDIFIQMGTTRIKVEIDDPNNEYDDYDPSWWRPSNTAPSNTVDEIPAPYSESVD